MEIKNRYNNAHSEKIVFSGTHNWVKSLDQMGSKPNSVTLRNYHLVCKHNFAIETFHFLLRVIH